MSVLFVLMLASLGVALVFLGFFVWAARSGQFDDPVTPALRVTMDEDVQGTSKQEGDTKR